MMRSTARATARATLRSTASARGRAFTLIEILCVIVILGIASAIIIPQLGSRDDLRAAAGARLLIADVLYAQNLAISQQRKQYIQFVGQQYTLLSRDSDTDPLTTVTHPVTKNPYVMVFGVVGGPLEGVRIDSVTLNGAGDMILGFDDLGTPFTYDGATVTPLAAAATIVVGAGNQTLSVRIEPFTGETSVQ